MFKLAVTAQKLNKRNVVPHNLPDPNNIAGTVQKGFEFIGEEVKSVPNPALGKWYKDKDGFFYWGGALVILEEIEESQPEVPSAVPVTLSVKTKIEQVINAFETGSAQGDYSKVSVFADYLDPETKTKIRQVTYGRSQTTEFGNLPNLISDYVKQGGSLASDFTPYLSKIGRKPSLETDKHFCELLRNAGKNDPVMKACQDHLFETKYYQPAHHWFENNGFVQPLSLLVIYDSFIHSGGILAFLRKRFSASTPSNGGEEKTWISAYVSARHNWLAGSDAPLCNTKYRTQCFLDQIANENWDLSKTINAHGVSIS